MIRFCPTSQRLHSKFSEWYISLIIIMYKTANGHIKIKLSIYNIFFYNKVQLQLVSQIFEYHLVRWWISMSPCMKWFQTNTLKCSTSNQNSKCNLGRSLFFFMHISTVKTGWFSTFWSHSTCWVFHTKGMSIQHSLFLPLGKIL